VIDSHGDLLSKLCLALADEQACKHFALKLAPAELCPSLFSYLAQSSCVDPEKFDRPEQLA